MKAGELLLAGDLVRAGVWGRFLATGDLDLDRPWLGAVTAAAVATTTEVTEAAEDGSQSTRRSAAAASSRGCR